MSARRPEVRADVALMSGYHSPQVDVEVRLNTNEAPEAPPEELTRRLAAALHDVAWHRYPDRSARELRAALAAYEGREPEQVFVANGSNEVLLLVLLAYGGPGRSAAVFEPTYALHAHIAGLTGTSVQRGARGEDLALDPGAVTALIDARRPELVMLCSPNNPSGLVDPPGTAQGALQAAASYGGLVVVDEAYGQFAESSAQRLMTEDSPLVVTRTFSKTWSMAALRLGYCLGPSWLIAELEKVALPYHLDTVKQIAGRLALEYRAEMEARVATLVAERERLVAALGRLPVRVWPSQANFVLFRPDGLDGQAVWEGLLARSVLVRNCASWPGLAGCLRVTVGTAEENDRFLAALEEVLG